MLSPPAGHTKHRRAKKARARQRSRYDLRRRYREQDLPAEHIGIATIEDPYSPPGYVDAEGNLDTAARLAPAQHHDGSEAAGAPGWQPPRRPTMTVFVALKDDPIGRLHSRHQIDEAQYQGARAYQECHDASLIGSVRSVNLSATRVSGGLPAEPLSDRQRRAAAKLRAIEGQVQMRYGNVGVWLVRLVLAERRPVEATARLAGATSARDMHSVGWLFRKCLDVIALATGFMSGLRRLGHLSTPKVQKLPMASHAKANA